MSNFFFYFFHLFIAWVVVNMPLKGFLEIQNTLEDTAFFVKQGLRQNELFQTLNAFISKPRFSNWRP